MESQVFSSSQTWRDFFVVLLAELCIKKNTRAELSHYQMLKTIFDL